MFEQNQKQKILDEKGLKLTEKFVPKTAEDSEEQEQVAKIQNKHKGVKKLDHKSQRWTLQQNKTYIKFLEEHAHLFRYKSVRRVRQVFILLSDKMNRKRTPAQCKSHHQKMRKATEKGTIKEIIRYMKKKHIAKQRGLQIMQMEKLDKKQDNEPKEQFTITTCFRYNKFEILVKVREELVSTW